MSNNLYLVKWARDAGLAQSCFQRQRIYDYKPGCVCYRFGHYPTRNPYYPTGADWELLDMYRENGVEMLIVFEEWSDISGYFGKQPTQPINKEGFRRFIVESHRRGLKVLPYISPGYMEVRHPSYRPEWSRGAGHLVEVYQDLDKLCPGSPGHRVQFFCSVERLMDSYDLDGFYWDGGLGLGRPGCSNPKHDNHIHFAELATDEATDVDHLTDDVVKGKLNEAFCALWNEFLCEIYVRVKNRDGIVVAHIGSDTPSPFQDKCWDYQLLGEGIGDVLVSVEKTKYYDPYVIRNQDWSRLITNWKEGDFTPQLELVPGIVDLSMATSVPYLQFPWLYGGCRGKEEDQTTIPGVQWKQEWDHWTEWRKALQKAGRPFLTTGIVRDRYFEYLRIYRQMTKPNTIAYIEVKAIEEERFPGTEGSRRVSVFVNDSLWVAIGHLGTEPQKVLVRPLQDNDEGETITLSPKTLTVLRYYDLTSRPEVMQFSP